MTCHRNRADTRRWQSRVVLAPLAGFTVGVTADRRADEQAELLRRRGADVVHVPCVRTLPLTDGDELAEATAALIARPPDVLVALTGLGVRAWFEAADGDGSGDALRDALAGTEILARGPKAAGALHTVGLATAWHAPSEQSTEVVARLRERGLAGVRVAVQRDGAARAHSAEALAAAGADVVDVPIYHWTAPHDPSAVLALVDAAARGDIDAMTFTSAPAVDTLVAIAETNGRGHVLRQALAGVVVACVGPVCADRASAHGIRPTVVPTRWRLGPMVRVLADELAGRGRSASLGEHQAWVQGGAVMLDGTEIRLSRREQGVLHALLDAGGSVVAKTSLVREVWAPGTDAHVVEVTVGRLRKRLGAAGVAVETVPRRGYRLAASSAARASTGCAAGTADAGSGAEGDPAAAGAPVAAGAGVAGEGAFGRPTQE